MNKEALFYWLIDAQSLKYTFGCDKAVWAACHRIADKLIDSGVFIELDEYAQFDDLDTRNTAVQTIDNWRTK